MSEEQTSLRTTLETLSIPDRYACWQLLTATEPVSVALNTFGNTSTLPLQPWQTPVCAVHKETLQLQPQRPQPQPWAVARAPNRTPSPPPAPVWECRSCVNTHAKTERQRRRETAKTLPLTNDDFCSQDVQFGRDFDDYLWLIDIYD